MKLYLVQHGAACAKEVDPQRPLSDAGRADVERLSAFLGQSGVRVGRVIHSGKLRAEQTARCLAAAVAPGVEIESSGIINPNDNPRAFDWQSGSWDHDTLVVGHLPFMAKLVAHLVNGDENRPVAAFQPGSMVCLERQDGSDWQINWMIRPELLDGVQPTRTESH
jgi:phosphohistidine phosphatase